MKAFLLLSFHSIPFDPIAVGHLKLGKKELQKWSAQQWVATDRGGKDAEEIVISAFEGSLPLNIPSSSDLFTVSTWLERLTASMSAYTWGLEHLNLAYSLLEHPRCRLAHHIRTLLESFTVFLTSTDDDRNTVVIHPLSLSLSLGLTQSLTLTLTLTLTLAILGWSYSLHPSHLGSRP